MKWQQMDLAMRAVVSTVAGLGIAYGWWLGGCSLGADPGRATGNINPRTQLAVTPELLAEGKKNYEHNCAACHGLKGDGQGPASALLFPKPRDFVGARFRIVSTWDYAPLDGDIFRTLSRGMPGSAMPPWAHLPEQTRWALVHYIKTFARRPFEIRPDHQPKDINDDAAGKVIVPPEAEYTEESKARAEDLYKQNCANCHGFTGRGDGQQHQEDSEGNPVRPRDLTAGIYKGSPQPQEVYKRIMAGLPGSPMPSHPHLYGNDGWQLAHYVLAMSNAEQRAQMEVKRNRISVAKVDALPQSGSDAAWKKIPSAYLRLLPMWWRDARQETLEVQAVHDGKEIAFLLKWWDITADNPSPQALDLRDAVAVQFSLNAEDPPLISMENESNGTGVNIWKWQTASQPRATAADLFAAGMKNVQPLPAGNGTIGVKASYSSGAYGVLLRRRLQGHGDHSVSLQPGKVHPAAFSVWDGSAGDRSGGESFTIWQDLMIAP